MYSEDLYEELYEERTNLLYGAIHHEIRYAEHQKSLLVNMCDLLGQIATNYFKLKHHENLSEPHEDLNEILHSLAQDHAHLSREQLICLGKCIVLNKSLQSLESRFQKEGKEPNWRSKHSLSEIDVRESLLHIENLYRFSFE